MAFWYLTVLFCSISAMILICLWKSIYAIMKMFYIEFGKISKYKVRLDAILLHRAAPDNPCCYKYPHSLADMKARLLFFVHFLFSIVLKKKKKKNWIVLHLLEAIKWMWKCHCSALWMNLFYWEISFFLDTSKQYLYFTIPLTDHI